MRGRVWAAVAAVLLVCGGTLYVVLRDDGRFTVGELSCASDRFQSSAIDFQSPPTWNSPQAALQGTLAIHADVGSDVPSEGWSLDESTSQVARWERRSDGHVVALVEFPRSGNVWRFTPIEQCVDP